MRRTTHNPLTTAAVLSLLAAPALAAPADLPAGWFKAGSHPEQYEMGLDENVRRPGGKSSATVWGKGLSQGFGTLMQTSQPGQYSGRRIRLSGWVKSEKVTDWAGLWLRIDGASDKVLGFDNMQGRPIKGTTDWTRYEIVLDVPPDTVRLAFGLMLTGRGQVWMDDLSFEVVTTSVNTTGQLMNGPPAPTNLNFEK